MGANYRATFRPQAPLPHARPQAPPRTRAAGRAPGRIVVPMTTAPGTPPPTRLTARSPEDLLAVVPVVLGFVPAATRS